ncbi:MAG TPA: hypothetical protein VF874_15315, partial [Mycobacterium sp.]
MTETLNAAGLSRLQPTGGDPVDSIRWVSADTLDPNNWNPKPIAPGRAAAPRTFAALYRLVA